MKLPLPVMKPWNVRSRLFPKVSDPVPIAAVPGLRVVVLGDASEAPASLRAAASFDGGEAPTVLLLPRALILRELEAHEFKPQLGRPLGAARLVRAGSAATVFAIGAAVDASFAAVDASGFDAAIVEVSGLAPLDEAGVLAAAADAATPACATAAAPGSGGARHRSR